MTGENSNVEALRERARNGDAQALTTLAKRLLAGDGVRLAPEEGIELLRQAVAQGKGEAAALLSVCAAWGVGQPRDIVAALDALEQAANLGWTTAQSELQLLARDRGTDWDALRERVDVAESIAARPVRIARERPRILVLENFLSAEECSWLVHRGRPGLSRAMVYRGSATPQFADTRTNKEVSLTIFHADIVLNLIRERMSTTTRAPTSCFEIAKLLHYEPGQQFALHADFIQPTTPQLVQEIKTRGQRAATLLVYLTDEYEGGETEFPRIGLRFKGRRGDALLFSNVDDSGAPDYDTVHAGLPPLSGEKWVLSQWIRTRQIVR